MTAPGTVPSLATLLWRQACRRPRQWALVSPGSGLDYGELWRRIAAAADCLGQAGIREGDRVALCLPSGPDHAVALYALNRLGAVAAPLNPRLPEVSLRAMLGHLQPRAMLGRSEPPAGLGDFGWLDCEEWQQPTATSDAWLAGDGPQPVKRLTMLLYTSGTTGRPKGVMLSAGNLHSNITAIGRYLRLGPRDRTLCPLPFFYAYGNSVLLSNLTAGASLLLEEGFAFPQRTVARMQAENATGLCGVPSHFRLLLKYPRLSRNSLPSLRYITQAGGPLSPGEVEAVRRLWPHARFFVMYGQTEACARISYLPPERWHDKRGSAGRALPGLSVRILDPSGREVACGGEGEIAVRGPNVMLGYWRDPESTRQRLVDGWLRTGDLGRMDAEGFITVVGRNGDMVKVGDHRVAPGEVEEVISALPGVEDVAVKGEPDPLLGQVIHAYVVGWGTLSPREIMAHCRRHAPLYQVPRRVTRVAHLPRTASGKLQRHRLGEPAESVPAEGKV